MAQKFQEFVAEKAKDTERIGRATQVSVLTNIQREMILYESSGNMGVMLQKIHKALLSIPPTSGMIQTVTLIAYEWIDEAKHLFDFARHFQVLF